MREWKCNLEFWFKTVGKQFVLVTLMILALCLYNSFMLENGPMENMAASFIVYLIWGMIITVLSFEPANYTRIYPITISMGTTRKHSILAMNIAHHVYLFIYVMVALIILAVSHKNSEGGIWVKATLLLAAYFALMALAQFSTMITKKLGAIWNVLIIMAIFIVGGIGSFLIIETSRNSEVGTEIRALFEGIGSTTGYIVVSLIAVTAIVLDALMTVLFVRFGKNEEVKI